MNKATKATVVALAVAGALVGGNMCAKSIYVSKSEQLISEFNAKEKESQTYGAPILEVIRTVDKGHPFTNKLTEDVTVKITANGAVEEIKIVNNVSVNPFVGAEVKSSLINEGLIADLKEDFSFEESIVTEVTLKGEPVVSYNVKLNDFKSTNKMVEKTGVDIKSKSVTFGGVVDFGESAKGNVISENSNGVRSLGLEIKELSLMDKQGGLSVSMDKLDFTSETRSDKYDGVTETSLTRIGARNSKFSISDVRTGKVVQTATIGDFALKSGYVFDLKDNRTDMFFGSEANGLKMPDNSLIDLGIEAGKTYNSSVNFNVYDVDTPSLSRLASVATQADLFALLADIEGIATKVVNEGVTVELTQDLYRVDDQKAILDFDAKVSVPKNTATSQAPMQLLGIISAEAKASMDLKTSEKVRDREFRDAVDELFEVGFLNTENDVLKLDLRFTDGKLYSHGKEKSF